MKVLTWITCRLNIKKIFLIFNGVTFYIYWWVSLWGASVGKFCIGPLLAVSYFILHFILITNRKKELKYMLFCILTGIIFESILLYSGFVTYKGIFNNTYNIVPIWPIVLWAGYSLTVFHSFKYIKGNYFISFILGAFFAPLIHISGNTLGAITFNYNFYRSYLILMAMWSICFPLLNYASVKIND